MNLSAVILAGGKSSRMGRDKARLEMDGRPMLARQIQLARETGAAKVFVSGHAERDYLEFGCPVLFDRLSDAGPLAGIERALTEISSSWLLVLAVDMPNLTPAILQQMAKRGAGTTGVIPRVNGRIEPLAAIYPKAASCLALALLDDERHAATTFAELCVGSGLARFHDLPAGAAGFFASCNTPSDLLPSTVTQC